MLTGQEQYYFERAGYFVRREVLVGGDLIACRAAEREMGEYPLEKDVDSVSPPHQPSLACGTRRIAPNSGGSRDEWIISDLLPHEPALTAAFAHPRIHNALEDLLGPNAVSPRVSLLISPKQRSFRQAWRREQGPDLDDAPEKQRAYLAVRRTSLLVVHIALLEDHGLWVVPGTHDAPLLPEQRAALLNDACGDVPGQVCVRLAPGDAVFFSANLLHRQEGAPDRPRCTLRYAVTSAFPS